MNINQYYQKAHIENNEIILQSHSLGKYNFIKEHEKLLYDIGKICDYGCNIGIISIKLASIYKNISFTLCDNHSDIQVAYKLIDYFKLNNVNVVTDDLMTLTMKYDLGIYYAIIHFLINVYDFDTVMNKIILTTNKYAILEFPLLSDFSVQNLLRDNPENTDKFNVLKSLESIILNIEKYFDIIKYRQINYDDPKLIRYAFLIKIKLNI